MAMETVVIVAVSILGVVFVASLVTLLIICRQKYRLCRRHHSILSDNDDDEGSSETVVRVGNNANENHIQSTITFDDGTIRHLLETEDWANDIHGLVPHCIAILKMCREVTEKLVALTLDRKQENVQSSDMAIIVGVAKRITPRVDDVISSIAPPLNPISLESKCSALIYSVQHLAILVRKAWQSTGSLEWIDIAFDTMADHMRIISSARYYPQVSQHNNKPDVDANAESSQL
nr:transmembrane protein 98 [Ciona intestinalis]|eukprot:XP_018669736.1 transmembrane protein 98 [Ciona intestinalis]